MLMTDDKVGGWVKKGQNHDDVILEWSLTIGTPKFEKRTKVLIKSSNADSNRI